MNRTQRNEPLVVEPDSRRRCKRTITLQGTTYRCVRGGRETIHEGAHDANATAADGLLVRW